MNVIFDIADVLLDWDISIMLEHIQDPGDRGKIVEGVIEHEDWLDLDRGRISLASAIERGACRTGLPVDVIAEVMDAIPRSLVPNSEAVAILRDVDKSRHSLFCLSNLHKDTWEGVFKMNDFWGLFDGILISWEVGFIKPEKEMYSCFLERFHLDPESCVFIDDRPGNIEGALEVGIQSVLFKNAQDCRVQLMEYLGD